MRLAFVLLVVFVHVGTAHADARVPKRFWLGATTSMNLVTEPSEFTDGDTLVPQFGAGLDLGFQNIKGGTAFSLDGDLLPISGVYRGRASAVLGYGFTTKYRLPCAAPPGMSCVEIYGNRDVRSVFGLKLGVEAITAPKGESVAVEIGLGFRSQISFDLSFLYDPAASAPGVVMDFTWQLGPFYWGFENRAVFSKDQPVPAIVALVLGYTPRMWGRRDP